MESLIIVVPADLVEKATGLMSEHPEVILDDRQTTSEKSEFVCPSIEVAEAFGTAVFE